MISSIHNISSINIGMSLKTILDGLSPQLNNIKNQMSLLQDDVTKI